MPQEQDIKGFTLLELLVVIVIISVISAVGYPKFTSWKKDREVRFAAEKVANLITNINTQTQRGSYPFVQLYIKPSNSKVEFITKGQTPERYNKNLNNGNRPVCSTANSGAFDNNEYEKYDSEDEKISIQIDAVGTVCFSQNGKYFQKGGVMSSNTILKLDISDAASHSSNYIIFCSKDKAANTGNKCRKSPYEKGLEKPAYLVQWSRFGNVTKFKWSGSAWTRQQ